MSSLHQEKSMHISNHIQEWHRRKRLIKAYISPKFLLEWFLKYLFPYNSKDVSTSRVTSKEKSIFKSQQLDLIYAQSGMLNEILPNALKSNYDPRKNLGPHVDGIIGSANDNSMELLMNQLKDLSLRHSVVGQASSSSSTPTQSVDVHFYIHRPTRMVTNNQEEIEGNDMVIIISSSRWILVASHLFQLVRFGGFPVWQFLPSFQVPNF
jgi:hypothetical protein